MRGLRRFLAWVWRRLLEPLWLFVMPLREKPLISDRRLKVKDFELDMRIPKLPCLVARVVWSTGEIWEVCSLDGVHWFREPEGTVVRDPARRALVQFYTVCCEIATYVKEGKHGSR